MSHPFGCPSLSTCSHVKPLVLVPQPKGVTVMAKRILRVNMTDLKATYEPVPEKWSRWAGRGLTSAIVCDEIDPLCHPLGPNNKVVIAPGWVTGSPAAHSSGRTSFG